MCVVTGLYVLLSIFIFVFNKTNLQHLQRTLLLWQSTISMMCASLQHEAHASSLPCHLSFKQSGLSYISDMYAVLLEPAGACTKVHTYSVISPPAV